MLQHIKMIAPVLVVVRMEFVATNVFVSTAGTKRLLKTNGQPSFMTNSMYFHVERRKYEESKVAP